MQKYEEEMEKELSELDTESFIKKLVQTVYQNEKDLKHKVFHLGLSSVIAKYLMERQYGIVNPYIQPDNYGVFFASILGTIKLFSSNKRQEDMLIVKFFEKITDIGLSFYKEEIE